jgi:cytoskeleton protein RodZ
MVRLNPRSFRVLNQDSGADIMHPVEGADHVGAFLREARETTGRTVADVAQNLRIRRVYLEAIEDGRFDELPGATYAVGFVRSYAAYLRLDAPTLVARFKEEASGIQAPQELEFPTPVPEGRFPGGLLVTICLLVGAAAFGGWYWVQSQSGIEVARVPAPPGDVQESPETSASPPDSPASPAPSRVTAAAEPESIPFEGPMSAPETVAAAPATIAEPDDSAPVTDEPEVPLVPPSYLQPQGDPLASMADVPDLADASANPPADVDAQNEIAETPAPDVTSASPAAELSPADAARENAEIAETPDRGVIPDAADGETAATDPASTTGTSAITSPADVPAAVDAPPAEAEVVAVTPAPAEFSSEPAIIALPEIEESQAPVSASPAGREGRTYGARNAAARIILRAEENTWVQIRDAEENVILTQMLQAGDRYLVPNRNGMRLMTGNAGGLDISVDGDAVPAIGERGESRRDVRLDPDLLKTGTAVVR